MRFYATAGDEVIITPLHRDAAYDKMSLVDRLTYVNNSSYTIILPEKNIRTSGTNIFFTDGDYGARVCVRMYAASSSTAALEYLPADFLPYGKALRHTAYSEIAALVDVYLAGDMKCVNNIHGIAYMALPDGNCIVGTVEPMRDASLDKILGKDELTMTQKLDILRQISVGLDSLHENGIVHNDLKPSNILVMGPFPRMPTCEGDNVENIYNVYLGDLDLSCRLGEAVECVGTHGYMSPEMYSSKAVTEASDSWAMANMLHEFFFDGDLINFADIEGVDIFEYMSIYRDALTNLEEDDEDDEFSRAVKSLIIKIISYRPKSVTDDILGLIKISERDRGDEEDS
jgi:serine/threonine protein kinase